MLKDGTNERSYRPCSSRARQVNENEVFVRSGASEASGAERRSPYNYPHVPTGIELNKKAENVHFRSHCYIRCKKTSFSGERNLEDWQDILYDSL